MFNPFLKVLLALLLALTSVVVATDFAAANSATPPTSLGYDISFPQCGSNLPSSVGFGIVGVNDGHPFSTNPCLVRELQWAKTTLTRSPEFYANTANPGPSNNSNWPTIQQTPQICLGANSVACSYDFGWNAAQGSFRSAVVAETKINSSTPLLDATAAHWWLDVESGNAWETIRTSNGPTAGAYANDQAVIQGELAYFASQSVVSVGIYSTGSQWRGLIGVTGSTFATTKVWLPGYGSLSAAQAACSSPSFTGGRVAMIQYPSIGLDGDYSCGLVSGPNASSVSVASSALFTDQLAVAGENVPVTYVQNTGSRYLVVSNTGRITTVGTLPAGTYSATGTSSASGDSGIFTFSLVVGKILQNPPASASASVAVASTYTDQLAVSGTSGLVTYVQSSGAPALAVSSTGFITTSGKLTRGSYVARGTMTDAGGDRGTFSFNLKVGAITQNLPIRAAATTVTSATFTNQLAVSGSSGPVTYAQTFGAPYLIVSPTGVVTTRGALTKGSYSVRGTMTDASGDRGTYFFNLAVAPTGIITQNLPLRSSITTDTSAAFTEQLAVGASSGPVTFAQTFGAPSISVSPTGAMKTSGSLSPGSYVVRGTMTDVSGDRGTFFFNLVVGAIAPSPIPRVVPPIASRVLGHAVAGRIVTLKIIGSGFFGRPSIHSHVGTITWVTHDSGTVLEARVFVRPKSRNGLFTYTLTWANGTFSKVRYVQR